MLFAFLLLLALSPCVFAVPGAYTYIYDYSDILTDSEEKTIEDALESLNSSHDSPFVIITKKGNPDYTATQYAENFCSGNSIFSKPGFIFVDDFDNDKFYISPVGSDSTAQTKEKINEIYDELNSYYDTDAYCDTYLALVRSIEKLYAVPSKEDVSAETTSPYGENYDFSAPDSKGEYITDWADLFTSDEEAAMLTKVKSIKSKYNIDVVLHTTNSIKEKSVQDYADDFYDYNGYGVGKNHDGLLFMLNMNNGEEGNRDYYTSTTGSAITALTDYAIKDSGSYINSEILPYLADGEYYKAFDKYLDLIDIFFAQAATGTAYDSDNPYRTAQEIRDSIIFAEILVLVFALLISEIVIKRLKKKMSIAETKTQAFDYLKPGSTEILYSTELFSHTSVNRTPKPKASSSDSSYSDSSTHTSSSGTTHGGGGGKF